MITLAGISLLLSVTTVLGRPGDRCLLPKETGPCRLSLPAFYYNPENERCESFTYGGCQGNDNQFNSLKECQDACQEDLEKNSSALNPSVKLDYCKSNPLTGNESCFASIPMFTFDYETLNCKPYSYGGCNGSPNLFQSILECMSACVHGEVGQGINVVTPGNDAEEGSSEKKDRNIGTDICDLPPVHPSPRSCLASIPKWTYDKTKGECISFIYGGCGGTENNFDSEEDCKAACPMKASGKSGRPDFCHLPTYVNEGPAICLLLNQGFTFNKDSETCEFIEFGGCGATKNFFSSLEKCQEECKVEQS